MKRRVVLALLVLFALWPALHRGLVATYELNPWKLAGWAMYARPHFPSRLAVRLRAGGEERALRELTDWEQLLAAEYLERRYSLGRLASPEALAEQLLRRHPEAQAVVIETRTRFFDLASATIRRRVEQRAFTRGG